jgi:hypothetical protein
MSVGGFMGLGHSHYPIPWSALVYDKSKGGFRTNITEQQLKDAPQFIDDAWTDRDWETRTHQHNWTPAFFGASRSGDVGSLGPLKSSSHPLGAWSLKRQRLDIVFVPPNPRSSFS